MMWSVQGKPLKMSTGAGRMVVDKAENPMLKIGAAKMGCNRSTTKEVMSSSQARASMESDKCKAHH